MPIRFSKSSNLVIKYRDYLILRLDNLPQQLFFFLSMSKFNLRFFKVVARFVCEPAEILAVIRNKPTPRDGYDYRLKTDLTWEEYALPPIEPEPPTDEEALTRYANTLTGADDPDLISAAETLIEQRIKEEQ